MPDSSAQGCPSRVGEPAVSAAPRHLVPRLPPITQAYALRVGRLLPPACRLAVGAVFLWAGIGKLLYRDEFLHTLIGYRLVPPWGASVLATVLPWAEVLVAGCLLAGWRQREAATAAAGLLATFIIAIGLTLARGIHIGDCGCFPGSGPPGGGSLLRDGVFLIASMVARSRHPPIFGEERRPPRPAIWRRLAGGFLRISLSGKVVLAVMAMLAVGLVVMAAVSVKVASSNEEKVVGRQMLALARMFDSTPGVGAAFDRADTSRVLEPLAMAFLRRSGADLIVVIDMADVRVAHFEPQYIGTRYTAGDEGPALHGRAYFTRAWCIGGPSIRGLAPIYGPGGRQVGVAVVGKFVNTVTTGVERARSKVFGALVVVFALGSLGAVVLGRAVRRATCGLEPKDITMMLQQREAILRAIREGVVAVDMEGRIVLVNEAACRLLQLDSDVAGTPVAEVFPNSTMAEVIRTARAQYDREQVIGDKVIISSTVPVMLGGQVAGAVATFRDKTEVARLAQELAGVKHFVEGLRAQRHEFTNRLHVIAGLIQLGAYEEVLDYVLEGAQRHHDFVDLVTHAIREPVVAGLLVGKFNEAAERGVTLQVDPQSHLDSLPASFDSHALVCVLGNLLENAIESVAAVPGRREVRVSLCGGAGGITLTVADTGRGIPAAVRARLFQPGVTTKGPGRGLGLHAVRTAVVRAGGSVTVETDEGGTRVTVRVPVVCEAAGPNGPIGAPS